jgi:hypothetical protein
LQLHERGLKKLKEANNQAGITAKGLLQTRSFSTDTPVIASHRHLSARVGRQFGQTRGHLQIVHIPGSNISIPLCGSTLHMVDNFLIGCTVFQHAELLRERKGVHAY